MPASPAAIEEAATIVPPTIERGRAELAARRLKFRGEVASCKAQIASTEASGFSADSSLKALERLKHRQEKEFNRDGYVYGLAKNHILSVPDWEELGYAYRAAGTRAEALAKRGYVAVPSDADSWEKIAERLRTAMIPCGSDLNRDEDMDWVAADLKRVLPTPVLEKPTKAADDLATETSFLRLLGKAVTAAPTQATIPTVRFTPSERVRLKADVAHAKAEIARTTSGTPAFTAARAKLEELDRLHRTKFDRDGYIYGFSADHALSPSQWEALAEAYAALAEAMERGLAGPSDARAARAAVERFESAMRPAGRSLRFDEDADDLREEIAARHPRLARAEAPQDPLDKLRPRLVALGSSDDEAEATELALDALEGGVRPSHPVLREALLDWTDIIVTTAEHEPALAVLARELLAERDRRESQAAEPGEPVPEDAEYLAQLDLVRARTTGKRLLIVGGGNREETRQGIERELGLAEAHWPDSDEHSTKPTHFDTLVDNADIVLKTRFCRRGYQRALARAKTQGKPVVALTAGYNPRQVVRAMHEQWFSRV